MTPRRRVKSLKPAVLPLKVSGVPEELRELRQWVCWKYELESGKWSKVPYQPLGGRASSIDPSTWSSFDTCVKAYGNATRFDGIGFVTRDDDPYVIVDLDHVRDATTGNVESWAKEILDVAEAEGAYIEISVSGTGFHFFGKGVKEYDECKSNDAEIYCHSRYLTVSGHGVKVESIGHVTQAFDLVFARITPKGTKRSESTSPNVGKRPSEYDGLSDADILERAFQAEGGDRLRALLSGDRTGFRSDSEADMAAATRLAFWFWLDPEVIERVMRASKLYRNKWDGRRGNASLLRYTINSALRDKDGSPRIDYYGKDHGSLRVSSNENPHDLWSPVGAVPTLPRGILPRALEELAFIKPTQFAPEALAASALAVCAMATSSNIRESLWHQRFVLWCGLVGPSSCGKSPVVNLAAHPLAEIESAQAKQFIDELAAWNRTPRDDRGPEPIRPRFITQDATIEGLMDVLVNANHGCGLVNGELSTLVNAMDGGGYKDKQMADRGSWLLLHDAHGPYNNDRRGNGAKYIPYWGASVLGGITTDKMDHVMRNGAADGLMSRFSLITMAPSVPSRDTSRVSGPIYELYCKLIRDLVSSRPSETLYVSMSNDAQETFGASKEEWEHERNRHAEALPRYAERLGKVIVLAPRIALGFAIIEHKSHMPATISGDQMRRAIAWLNYQRQHDEEYYTRGGRDSNPRMVNVRRIAAWILRFRLKTFLLGDITRALKEWSDVASHDQVRVMDLLEQFGWCHADKPVKGPASFTRGTRWTVNARVHEIYAERAEFEKKRAVEAKRLLDERVAIRRAEKNA